MGLIAWAVLFTFLQGCGNNEKAATDDGAKPQSMIPDKPKDDGQGIGKFKEITLAALDEKIAAQGKTVFESKCSACHNPTDVKKVGPGLLGVTDRRKPAWILNMITNPQEMTQKDPTAKDLLAQHLTQMTFQDVSDDQAKQLLEYLRMNDKQNGTAQAKK
jgi:mono/diheme cytochrome c family protein